MASYINADKGSTLSRKDLTTTDYHLRLVQCQLLAKGLRFLSLSRHDLRLMLLSQFH